jgi:hypothetical protein
MVSKSPDGLVRNIHDIEQGWRGDSKRVVPWTMGVDKSSSIRTTFLLLHDPLRDNALCLDAIATIHKVLYAC